MPFLMSVGGFHYKLAQILTHVSSDFALWPAIRSNGRHAGASEQKKTKQMHLKQNITVRKKLPLYLLSYNIYVNYNDCYKKKLLSSKTLPKIKSAKLPQPKTNTRDHISDLCNSITDYLFSHSWI